MFEVEVVNSGTIVVDEYKLVDAVELSDQHRTEVRLYPADEVLGTHWLAAG